ncbi:MAG: hypothetical protein KA746_11825 [Pyrinomonadaceae bacterium]|nr:hypothetical protein [Pyrinomonadaceae bacterium]MBP6211683.1 hypothetical protein [Pyrinomonadaceae bacterium]
MRAFSNIVAFLALAILVQTVNAEWVRQRSASLAWFLDITFVTETKGWIVGSDGTMLSTNDGGTTWKAEPRFTTDTIREIHFTDENNGWLLCERNIFTRGQNAVSYLRRTNDGGKTWERVEFEDAGHERVVKLLFNKLGTTTAFGEGGIFYKLQEDGRTWKKSLSPIRFLLLGGAFGSGPSGAIAGAGGTILFTSDSGLTWEPATIIGKSDARFNAVHFVGEHLGWAVGSRGSIIAATGGGRLWRTQESGVDADLNDVFFTSSNDGWAVGDDGTIIRTRNGGNQWTLVNSHVKHKIERIVFNGKRGWAVGFGGTILSYSDATKIDPDGKPTIRPRN